jgi:hypothetical protein
MEPNSSLCTHKCPPPVHILNQSNPVHTPSYHFLKTNLIVSSLLHLGFPSALFPPGLPTKTLYAPHLSPKSATCPTQTILLDLITWITSVRKTDHKDHHYVVFSTPLLPHPSQAQISSSAPILKLPQPHVPPSVWETKLHTYTKQQAKIQFCIS